MRRMWLIAGLFTLCLTVMAAEEGDKSVAAAGKGARHSCTGSYSACLAACSGSAKENCAQECAQECEVCALDFGEDLADVCKR